MTRTVLRSIARLLGGFPVAVLPFTDDQAEQLMLLDGAAADVKQFWPLERFSVYDILARKEKGDPDEPLDRPASVAELAALLAHMTAVLDVADARGGADAC